MDISGLRKVLTFDPGPVPGLGAPLIATFLVLEWIAGAVQLQGTAGFSDASLHAALLVASALVALAAHYAGNFWDAQLFDPYYGLSGSWRRREDRPWFGLLPSGRDLDDARMAATAAIRTDPRWTARVDAGGRGVYAASIQLLAEAGLLKGVAGLLAWSKVFRSLLWPLLLGAIAFAAAAAGSGFLGWLGNPTTFGLLSIAAIGAAILALAPYFGLRVDYMTRVYELVDRFFRSPVGDRSGRGARTPETADPDADGMNS